MMLGTAADLDRLRASPDPAGEPMHSHDPQA